MPWAVSEKKLRPVTYSAHGSDFSMEIQVEISAAVTLLLPNTNTKTDEGTWGYFKGVVS